MNIYLNCIGNTFIISPYITTPLLKYGRPLSQLPTLITLFKINRFALGIHGFLSEFIKRQNHIYWPSSASFLVYYMVFLQIEKLFVPHLIVLNPVDPNSVNHNLVVLNSNEQLIWLCQNSIDFGLVKHFYHYSNVTFKFFII